MAARPVETLADQLGMEPGDIRALLATYGPEVVDLWEEEGIIGDVAVDEVLAQFDPWGLRTVPELFWPALRGDRRDGGASCRSSARGPTGFERVS
jgi:hypothetical protein